MDDPLTDSALRFQCPRCGHEEQDDYETIDVATPVLWRCGGCLRPFSLLLMECARCAAETVATALDPRELISPSGAACPSCGEHGFRHVEPAHADPFA